MNNSVISVREVHKSYGSLKAVKGLSFDVEPNTCFGFLGPNGAGKTTMMRMIYAQTMRDAEGGSINVLGFDPAVDELSLKYLTGVVSQDNNLDEELNVIQNLLIFSRFYDIPQEVALERIEELLAFLELSDKRTSKIRELSGGMKRRLVIARSLLNHPKLLILDEPTTGLDPQVRHLIWGKLRQLKAQGTTLLLTTHYMEEAFQLCDSLIIMHLGKKIMEGAPRQLLTNNIESYVLELYLRIGQELAAGLTVPADVRMDRSEQVVRFYSDNLEGLKSVADQLDDAQYYLRQASLEDVFLKTTGRMLNDKQ